MKSLVLVAFFLFTSNLLLAQSLGKGYYVVVGAYAASKETYAQKFVETLKKDGFNAIYAKDEKRKMFLVYVERYEELKPSLSKMTAVRREQKFPDAWVRVIRDQQVIAETSEPVKEEPKIEQPKIEQPKKQQALTEVIEPQDGVVIKKDSVLEVVVDEPKPTIISSPPKEFLLTFHMFDATNSSPIDGKVEIVDAERARLMQKNKSTDTLSIPDPKSKSGTLSFITDVFGYRKIQHEVNYITPVVDSTKHYIDREGKYYVIQFEMVRYHKGDIATLYNVFFFNDAAIMMPESKYELNKLLDLMQSNPNYRIKLHGHTNGNSHGKIISMGPSKNFFSANATDVKTSVGSAKALSGQRAEVIREWLIAQGVAGDRVEVRSWGGRRMIHDKNSVNARRNVRVEVEVLSE